MKTLTKLAMLLAVLAICIPASADILTYKKTLKCWDAFYIGSDLWDIGGSRVRGYFVLEVNYNPDGTLAEVVGSAQIDYWRDREDGKLYEVFEHSFDIIRVADNRSVVWVLVEESADEGDITLIILRGRARGADIGNDADNEVARQFKGNHLFYLGDGDYMGTCGWSLRLYKKWTQWSNEDGDDLDAAVNNIEAWLAWKGYAED